jgi:hypothetical protein
MKLFGLVITTQAEIDLQIARGKDSVRLDFIESSDRVEQQRKENEAYWYARKEEVAAAWEEVNEAKASLILKEIANVMGGHWRS